MKKKTAIIKLSMLKYLLLVPVFLLTFCESEFEEPLQNSENKLTKDAKVLSLMKSAIKSDSNENLIKNKGDSFKSTDTEQDDQCDAIFFYRQLCYIHKSLSWLNKTSWPSNKVCNPAVAMY